MKLLHAITLNEGSIRFLVDPLNKKNTIVKLKIDNTKPILSFTIVDGILKLSVVEQCVMSSSVYYSFYEYLFKGAIIKTIQFCQEDLYFSVPFTDFINLIEIRDKNHELNKKVYLKRVDLMRYMIKKFK
jgi:hypothetical protein